MSHITAIARKEFKGFFSSPVAFLFLAVTLGVILVNFFRIENFFANNLADVRPLFAVMPWVLVLLVSALTMRLWSDEQKSGTLEVLMTLPIRNSQLVMGKFFAGWFLIVLALIFTLGIPLTVASVGPLDWGPVWGGYFAALLLGGAYLAMGLCVSSLTDNQIVSLIFTLVLGLLFYAIGREDLSSFLGDGLGNLFSMFSSGTPESLGRNIADVFKALGTTSHFKSIERGLLDSRDIFYFLGLIVFFLTLNGQIITGKRQLPRESRDESNRSWLVILLVINIVLMNVWMSPRALFRLDLTEDKVFTLSPVTQDLLQGLNEEVSLQLIISQENHELLKPLVPQIKDMGYEYANSSGGKLITEILDPTEDDELAATLQSRYNIEALPVPALQKYRQSIIAVYFHVLIKHGDRFEVLNLGDLIEGHQDPATQNVYVRFRNLEYDLTKTIKRVVHDFESLESAFSRFDGEAKMTLFFGRSAIEESPENQELYSLAEKVGQASLGMEKISQGKFSYNVVDPLTLGKDLRALFDDEGLAPESIYFSVRLEANNRREFLQLREDMDVRGLEQAIKSSLRRLMPGFTKTVGIWTGGEVTPAPRDPRDPRGLAGGGSPQTEYSFVREFLSTEYSVREVVEDIKNGRIPDDVDILLVAGIEEDVSEKSKYAFDQFVMSGRPVVVYQGIADANYDQYSGKITFRPFRFGLEDLLFQYGIQIVNTFVQSRECLPFFEGSLDRPRIKERYYSFLDIRGEGLHVDHPVTAGLRSMMLPWCSPVRYNEHIPVAFKEIVKSAQKSWRQEPQSIEQGNPSGAFEGPQTLAITARGPAVSWFKDKNQEEVPSEESSEEDKKENEEEDPIESDRTRPRLDKVEDVRIAVVGSHMAIKDTSMQLIGTANQFLQGLINPYQNSLDLLANLMNWGLEDTKLAQLRGRGHFARTLNPMDEKAMQKIEYINYALAGILLVTVLAGHYLLRSSRKPLVTFETAGNS